MTRGAKLNLDFSRILHSSFMKEFIESNNSLFTIIFTHFHVMIHVKIGFGCFGYLRCDLIKVLTGFLRYLAFTNLTNG